MAITLTIEVSETDELAEILAPLSPQERNNYAVAAMRMRRVAEEAEIEETNDPLTQDDIEAIRQGFADMDAGRMISGDEFFAALDAELDTLRQEAAAKR